VKTLGLLALLIALDADAQMYKCVDERGKIRYTDQPQAGCKESDIRSSPPMSGAVTPPKDDFAGQEADFKRRQNERATQAAQEGKEREARDRRCARLRQEHGVLAAGTRIARINDKGERVYLEDAAREQRIASLEQELRGCQ
jgi:hypothetical protein